MNCTAARPQVRGCLFPGGCPPQGCGGVGLWATATSESSCPVVAPSLGQPPYQPLCITSGRVPKWGSLARPERQAFTRGSLPLAQVLLLGEGKAGGFSEGAALGLSVLLCLRREEFCFCGFKVSCGKGAFC